MKEYTMKQIILLGMLSLASSHLYAKEVKCPLYSGSQQEGHVYVVYNNEQVITEFYLEMEDLFWEFEKASDNKFERYVNGDDGILRASFDSLTNSGELMTLQAYSGFDDVISYVVKSTMTFECQ